MRRIRMGNKNKNENEKEKEERIAKSSKTMTEGEFTKALQKERANKDFVVFTFFASLLASDPHDNVQIYLYTVKSC